MISVSKSCSYLLRHDKNISHGSDGGVDISVTLSELRIGAGGDPGRPHLRSATGLIAMLSMGSNKLQFQACCVGEDEPSALRATQGLSVIEAKSALMEWKRTTASDAPRFTTARASAT